MATPFFVCLFLGRRFPFTHAQIRMQSRDHLQLSGALGRMSPPAPFQTLVRIRESAQTVLALPSPCYSSGSAPRKEAQACAQLTLLIFTWRNKGPQNNSTPSVNVYAVMKYTNIQQLYIWAIYSFLLTDSDIMKSCA